jgi:hypothetical protein
MVPVYKICCISFEMQRGRYSLNLRAKYIMIRVKFQAGSLMVANPAAIIESPFLLTSSH